MLKYRLSEDTNEHFEGIESRELTLFIIHKDISYEYVVSNSYDINNCISVIDQFIIKPYDDYPDAITISYGSTTLQLLPVNLGYKLLHNEIHQLKERIKQLELAEYKVQIQIPMHIPAFYHLHYEIVYEHWDNLDDLLAVYPLQNDKEQILSIYDYIMSFMKKIPTFDLGDDLSKFIDDHKNYDFVELTTSCRSSFVDNDKINIHILRYIIYMASYYNTHANINPPDSVLLNCYIAKNTCVIKTSNTRIRGGDITPKPRVQVKGRADKIMAKNTFRFYINDFTKCKHTVCCQ